MSALEKVAWTEIVVSLAAIVLAAVLIPWLGPAATGAFALLGLLGFTAIFIRRRGTPVVVDERDREIERHATRMGIAVAWMMLFTVLIAASLSANYAQTYAVSTEFLNWLIWLQFAICYATKGLTAVAMYRSQQRAA
jgi:hypothetical protein